MTTFESRRRFAGAESHRYVAIAEPLVSAFLELSPKDSGLLNGLGVDFRSSSKFNKHDLDARLVEAEKKLEGKPSLADYMDLYVHYHEAVVQNLKNLKGRPIIFTPSLGHSESADPRLSSIIGDDYFSNDLLLSRAYLESGNEVYRRTGKVPSAVLVPSPSHVVFFIGYAVDDLGGLKLVHALKDCCDYANSKTRHKYHFRTLEKSLNTLSGPFFKNYSISPAYYTCEKRIENKSDPYHDFKEEHRKIHRTIASYCLAFVMKNLELKRAITHMHNSGFEAEIMKGACRLSGSEYVPMNPLGGAKMPEFGLCSKESQRVFKRLLVNLDEGKAPESNQLRLF